MVFIHLTKAFDSVSHEGLWKLLLKAGWPGCPLRVVKIIRSSHDGMMARVSDLGTTSEAFPVTTGTKQDCIMAPLPFCIIFSAMLQDAFRNCNSGAMIRFRSDDGIFNPQRLKARTKVSLLLLRELLFADDCALIAYTEASYRASSMTSRELHHTMAHHQHNKNRSDASAETRQLPSRSDGR